jgi:hypothetical protein
MPTSKLEELNNGLRLAIEERTGRDPGPISVYDPSQWELGDVARAIDILREICGGFWGE